MLFPPPLHHLLLLLRLRSQPRFVFLFLPLVLHLLLPLQLHHSSNIVFVSVSEIMIWMMNVKPNLQRVWQRQLDLGLPRQPLMLGVLPIPPLSVNNSNNSNNHPLVLRVIHRILFLPLHQNEDEIEGLTTITIKHSHGQLEEARLHRRHLQELQARLHFAVRIAIQQQHPQLQPPRCPGANHERKTHDVCDSSFDSVCLVLLVPFSPSVLLSHQLFASSPLGSSFTSFLSTCFLFLSFSKQVIYLFSVPVSPASIRAAVMSSYCSLVFLYSFSLSSVCVLSGDMHFF